MNMLNQHRHAVQVALQAPCAVVRLTAASNGFCVTGPWEMKLKRSISYNVNNDPSFHCAPRDKSIKEPSHLQHPLPTQYREGGKRENRRNKKKRSRNRCQNTKQCSTLTFKRKLFYFFFFFLGHALVICCLRFVARWKAFCCEVILLSPQ
ncbi:hypothetical protein AMECASPLE_002835 [Ameca splendens]|uniref:Uncharacterized protein n=1 Tax=Ameca splendens TaxID=208324 RepID=A0ABV0Z784_9TELE